MHETPESLKHRQETASRLSEAGRKYFKFIEFDENEELVTEIRKDPVGLIIVLLTGGFVTIALLLVAGVVAGLDLSQIFTSSAPTVRGLLVVGCLLGAIGTVIMTAIAAYLYVSNVIYVTSEKIAQVLYLSLFNRKISQLSIGDVQDVTVSQKGILAHIFDYGTLVIETAGEQENYSFNYVPDPYQVSKMIVGAHETNLVKYGN